MFKLLKRYSCINLPVSIAFSFINARSLANSIIFQPNNVKKPMIIVSKSRRHTKTATTLDTFFLSIQLQKGRKSVAKIPPIQSGIKKSLAKYNPEKTRKVKSIFFITEVSNVSI